MLDAYRPAKSHWTLKAPVYAVFFPKENPDREEQIFDCLYADLFSNPIAVVKRVYEKFGLEYTKEFEQNMKVYLENNKQGKYGRHKYSLEE